MIASSSTSHTPGTPPPEPPAPAAAAPAPAAPAPSAPALSHDRPAVEGSYGGPHPAGVVVCAEGGYLAYPEIYSVSDEPITAWPDPRFIER
ncbi:hypothetical protein [Streptomyces sp. T028]|uniref:hypothetical protein n=1 Tax=Streptomyces sp. T028 TaxID=3394379 RepID=UPI003A89C7EE